MKIMDQDVPRILIRESKDSKKQVVKSYMPFKIYKGKLRRLKFFNTSLLGT